ncbi:MAG: zf-HC2 domain-containing protein, partial [Candidatus Gastranaerophilaceae bacterium]
MALQTNSEYKISEQGFQAVKQICSNINDEQSRKRAFKALLCLDVLADALDSEGYKVDISKNLYKILPLNEEFEFTDLHYNGRFVDVLPVVNEKFILIPKIHFEYDIVPDIYVVAEYRDKNVRFFGCINSSNLDKNNQNDKYYIMETTNLLPLNELEKLLNNPKTINLTDKSHTAFAPYFINYVDGTLNENNKKRLVAHLIECQECRDKFVEFFDYEIIAKNSAKYPDIMDDHTLDIVGAAAVNDEKYKNFEEITLEIDKEPDEYEEDDETESNKNIRPAIEDPLQVLYGAGNQKKVFKDIVSPKPRSVLGDIIKDFENDKEVTDAEPVKEPVIIEKKETINPEYYQEDLSDGINTDNVDVNTTSVTEIINGDGEDDPVIESETIIIDTDKVYKENIEEIIPAKKDIEFNDNEDNIMHFDAEDVDLIDESENFVMNAAEEETFTNSQLEDVSNSVVADFIDNNINDVPASMSEMNDDDFVVSSDLNKSSNDNDVLILDDAVNAETIEDDSDDTLDFSNVSDDDFFVSNTIENKTGGENIIVLDDDTAEKSDVPANGFKVSDVSDDDFFVSNMTNSLDKNNLKEIAENDDIVDIDDIKDE